MRAVLVLAIVAGCGRIDFDPETHAVDASSDVIAASDSPSCGASAGAWTHVQGAGNSNNTGTTLSVGVNATGGGDMMIVAVQGQAPGVATLVQDGAGSSYTRLGGAVGTDAAASNTVEIWYSSDLGGGANDVWVTFSTVAYAIVAWEFSSPRPAVVDTVAQLSNQAASPTPVAPTITTQCPNEIVIAAVVSAATVNGIAGGNEFTNDANTNNNGWAHITDPHAPAGTHTAEWTSAGASYCSAAAAFIVD